MIKFRYKCKFCGQIVNDSQRNIHAHKHHPAVPFGKLDIFANIDFIRVIDSPLADVSDKPKTNKTFSSDSVINPLKKEISDTESKSNQNIKRSKPTHKLSLKDLLDDGISKNEQISSSDIIAPDIQNYKPANVPYEPKSNKDNDLFEYAVKRIANLYQKEKDILSPKTHQEWMNYCFDRKFVSTPLREEYMSRIKAKYTEYFKKGTGRKYTFDFEKIARDYPHFFAFGKSQKPISRDIQLMAQI